MIDLFIAGVNARRAEAIAANVIANGADMEAKRMIRACNVVLAALVEGKSEYEAVFRQAFPRSQHSRGS